MRHFQCTCPGTLFFENSRCLNCGKEVGFCPVCRDMAPLLFGDDGSMQCGKCQAALLKCANYLQHSVCNRCVEPGGEALCDYCQLTDTVPDLDVEGNQRRWYDLEVAKRRLLYTLERVGLPVFDTTPRLRFDFRGNVEIKDALWRTVGTARQVFTGHAGGRITINIREADDEVREKQRVDLQESHRTLVGHFHHEIGHFYWELLVQPAAESYERFTELFGDDQNPDYSSALDRYYAEGPPAGWPTTHISAYATMHPWEDFAETFAAYLDMVSVADTAHELRPLPTDIDVAHCEMDDMLAEYLRVGIFVNELNRTLGLLDLLPDVFSPTVVDKLRFVHSVVRDAATPPAPVH